MTKWVRILLISFVMLAICGVVWMMSRDPAEPEYRGKRLSEWLRGYDSGGGSAYQGANIAVSSVGTNAIPLLLRLLREHDSSLKFKLLRLLGKRPVVKISYTPARILNNEATFAFHVLGPRASNAVSELIRIYGRNISPESQWATADSLGFIGLAASDAVPLLLTRACAGTTTNATQELVRSSAISALGLIHAQPDKVVPALMGLLQKPPNNDASFWAVGALGGFGHDAKPALPLLIKYYDAQTDKDLKGRAAYAIKKIDPKTAAEAWIQ